MGFKSDEYGILIQTIIVFIIGLYYLKKKFTFVHLSSFIVLFLIKIEFFCFSSTLGLTSILLLLSHFWSMYSLSGWCNCILNPSMSVAWFHWSLVVFKPFLLTTLVFAGTLSFVVIIITIIIIGVAICIS